MSRLYQFNIFFILIDELKVNLLKALIKYDSFVLGFLPTRSEVALKVKDPKPVILVFFVLLLSMIKFKNDSSNNKLSFVERLELSVIFFTMFFLYLQISLLKSYIYIFYLYIACILQVSFVY